MNVIKPTTYDEKDSNITDIRIAKKEEGRRRAKAIAIKRRIEREQNLGKELDGRENPVSSRHGARNQDRHQKFMKWLLKTFHQLEPGDRIADIAGGKGELAARMAYCHNLNVTIIDPREADVVKCFLDVVLPKLPKKWQHIYKEKSEKYGENYLKDEVMDRRVSQIISYFDERVLTEYDHKERNDKIEQMKDLLNSCSLLVGMHADSATEAIVDLALELEKPFVVVPCCVFPRIFPTRYIDGKQVRTHDQFCRYLAQKDCRLCTEELPFSGRNTAIWWNPV